MISVVLVVLLASALSPRRGVVFCEPLQVNNLKNLNGTDFMDVLHWAERIPAIYGGLLANVSQPWSSISQGVNASGPSSSNGKNSLADPLYNWPNWGNGIQNVRHAEHEHRISPNNAGSLVVKSGWPVRVFGDVSATPTVVNGTVYIVDWGYTDFLNFSVGPYLAGNGHLTAIDAETGHIKWTYEVRSYTGVDSASRTSPAVEGDILVIGTLHTGPNLHYLPNSTFIVAVNATTGDLLWKTMVDPHPLAGITMSPTIYDGGVYFGVSGMESGVKGNSACCSFKGTIQKLNLYTGELNWKFTTMPDGDYYGGAVWGSSPSIDVKRRQVYFATGQNYKVPTEVRECFSEHEGNYTAQAACSPPDNHFDSVLALDLDTGKLRWNRRFGAQDVYIAACQDTALVHILGFNCSGPPNTPNPDHDFGQAPMLILGKNGRRDLVVAGQKSAIVWALNPDNGELVWAVDLGGGSSFGGMEMGCASDGEKIFMSNQNGGNNQTTKLINPPPGGAMAAMGGFLSALDLDGNILWQAANPYPAIIPIVLNGNPLAALNVGPVTVANNVVYWPSYDPHGHLIFLDARTGQTLGSFATGEPIGSLEGGAAVVNGSVYVGSGYGVYGGFPGITWSVWGLTLAGKHL